jgi:diguanylate cyclase (GGDEF)-like protein
MIKILNNDEPSTFLIKSALCITAAAAILLTPFAINNFIQHRTTLGIYSLLIVSLCLANTLSCAYNRYRPLVLLLILVPCLILFLLSAFAELGVIAAFWCYPAALSFYFMLPERYAWQANLALYLFLFPEAWQTFEPSVAVRFAVTLLTASTFAAIFIRVINRQQLQLETIAVTDTLTGLFNRTRFQNDLEKAISQYQRKNVPMSILSMDLDHFKTINDDFGHGTGDKVLRDVGSYFKQRIRDSDSVFRMGGEEFIALLYDANLANASTLAEEIRRDIEALPLLKDRSVTISIGVAELNAEDDMDQWMKRCDNKLYQAKAGGRNQVKN